MYVQFLSCVQGNTTNISQKTLLTKSVVIGETCESICKHQENIRIFPELSGH